MQRAGSNAANAAKPLKMIGGWAAGDRAAQTHMKVPGLQNCTLFLSRCAIPEPPSAYTLYTALTAAAVFCPRDTSDTAQRQSDRFRVVACAPSYGNIRVPGSAGFTSHGHREKRRGMYDSG